MRILSRSALLQLNFFSGNRLAFFGRLLSLAGVVGLPQERVFDLSRNPVLLAFIVNVFNVAIRLFCIG